MVLIWNVRPIAIHHHSLNHKIAALRLSIPLLLLLVFFDGVGWGLQGSPFDLFDDAAKFGYGPAIVVGFE